jgi:uncharacterized protein with NRDE domain
MCLALVALHAHPRYRVLVAANRDEFHARAAERADWWPEGVLAGRDLAAGGTWLGVTRPGRWALITNYREPGRNDPTAPSRGKLVIDALRTSVATLPTAAAAALDRRRHNGFNLLVGDADGAVYASNRASGAVRLAPGIHGLSNHLLDTPWPKVTRSKLRVAACLARADVSLESLFELLADTTPAADAELPATGVPPEWERRLSSPFIVSAEYGTRCSTVLAIGHDNVFRLAERSFDPAGRMTTEVQHQFTLASGM